MTQGDDEFTVTFNANYAGLCRFLEGMTGRRSVAQELTQDCFLRLYRAQELRRSPDEVRFWLYRVARNLAINELRRNGTRLRLIDHVIDALRPARLNPEEEYESCERTALVREMLAGLPKHQRAALLLREGEEMSYGEIARVLQISESKVKIDIHRARQSLRVKWHAGIESSSPRGEEQASESGC